MWTPKRTITTAPSTTASVAKGAPQSRDHGKGQTIDLDDLLQRIGRLKTMPDKHVSEFTEQDTNDIAAVRYSLEISSSLPGTLSKIREKLCHALGPAPKSIKPLSMALILWGSLLEYEGGVSCHCVYAKIMALPLSEQSGSCDANVLILHGDGSSSRVIKFVKNSQSEEVYIFVQAHQLSEFSGISQQLIDHLKAQHITKYRLFSHTLTHNAKGKWAFRELTHGCQSIDKLRVYQPDTQPTPSTGSSGVIIVLLLLALAAVLLLLLWLWH